MKKHRSYSRVEKAINLLVDRAPERLSLDALGKEVGLSAFQFQREFTAWVGISPLQFSRVLTREFLLSRMQAPQPPQPLDTLAASASMSSGSRLHDLFTTLDAVTPQEYRSGGKGIEIFWACYETSLGSCLLAVTERGICNLELIEADSEASQLLAARWPGALLTPSTAATKDAAQELKRMLDFSAREDKQAINQARSPRRPLKLLVKGTNFQTKVWQALLDIPAHEVSSYASIANTIQKPTAQRAVANAIGSNPVALFIPCHRVIRSSGALGGYRWGEARKAALLAVESQSAHLY